MQEPQFTPEPPPRSWFGRNWIWVVPVGCLTPVLLCGGCFALIFFGVTGLIKSSEPYGEAIAKAKANQEVRNQLGEPIAVGYWTTGSVQVSNGTGSANFIIPISGPKKSGIVFVEATKNAGKWEYSKLEVQPVGSDKRIDLRTPELKPAPKPAPKLPSK
jgi:hypothetical protein